MSGGFKGPSAGKALRSTTSVLVSFLRDAPLPAPVFHGRSRDGVLSEPHTNPLTRARKTRKPKPARRMSAAEKLDGVLQWENLDFAADCRAWGNWFATMIMPNPWSPAESLDGSLAQSLRLMQSALDPALLAEAMTGNLTEAEVAGEAIGWWAYQMYGTAELQDDGSYAINSDSRFVENVVVAPSQKCPDDMCKAFGYSGNSDIIGIGVSDPVPQAKVALLRF